MARHVDVTTMLVMEMDALKRGNGERLSVVEQQHYRNLLQRYPTSEAAQCTRDTDPGLESIGRYKDLLAFHSRALEKALLFEEHRVKSVTNAHDKILVELETKRSLNQTLTDQLQGLKSQFIVNRDRMEVAVKTLDEVMPKYVATQRELDTAHADNDRKCDQFRRFARKITDTIQAQRNHISKAAQDEVCAILLQENSLGQKRRRTSE